VFIGCGMDYVTTVPKLWIWGVRFVGTEDTTFFRFKAIAVFPSLKDDHLSKEWHPIAKPPSAFILSLWWSTSLVIRPHHPRVASVNVKTPGTSKTSAYGVMLLRLQCTIYVLTVLGISVVSWSKTTYCRCHLGSPWMFALSFAPTFGYGYFTGAERTWPYHAFATTYRRVPG
jgi:hypothetical protein